MIRSRLFALGFSAAVSGALLSGCGVPSAARKPPPPHPHRATFHRSPPTPFLAITAQAQGTFLGTPAPAPAQLSNVSMATQDIGWAISVQPGGPPDTILSTSDGGRTFHPRYITSEPVVAIATPTPTSLDILENPCGGPSGCGASALLSSTDGGNTFHTIWRAPHFFASAMSFPDAEDGFIAGAPLSANGVPSTSLTLYVTHDGGLSWSSLSVPSPSICGVSVALQFTSPENGWLLCGGQPGAGQQAKALLHTTDGGAQWSTVAEDRYGASGWTGTAMLVGGYVHSLFFENARVGYIGLDRSGFLVTRDGGRTWSPAFTTTVPAGSSEAFSIGFLPGGFGWMLGGEGQPLFTTTNLGVHWAQVYPALLPTTDIADFSGGQAFGLGTWQGLPALLTGPDSGSGWSVVAQIGEPGEPLQVLRPDLFLSAGYNGIAESQNSGQTWSQIPLPSGWRALGLGYLSPGLGWVTAQSPQSTPGILACRGMACRELPTPFTPTAAIETGPRAGLAVGTTAAGQGGLFVTADAGQHWTTRLLPGALRPLGVGTSTYLWWIFSAHHILWSSDRGATWHEVTLPRSQTISSLSFQNYTTGLMTTVDASGTPQLWHTSDAGRTFTAVVP